MPNKKVKISIEELGVRILNGFRDKQKKRGYCGCRCPTCVYDIVEVLKEIQEKEQLYVVRMPASRKTVCKSHHKNGQWENESYDTLAKAKKTMARL